jgi:hypothetical protein
LKRWQNDGYIAEIKGMDNKKSRAISDPASGDLVRGAIHVILYEL